MSGFPLSFRPIRVGTMSLDHRLVVPPHSGGGGSQDDRAAPLAVADHLAGSGHDVTLVYESTAPSP